MKDNLTHVVYVSCMTPFNLASLSTGITAMYYVGISNCKQLKELANPLSLDVSD